MMKEKDQIRYIGLWSWKSFTNRKKVAGLMEDELDGVIMKEFAGFCPKTKGAKNV